MDDEYVYDDAGDGTVKQRKDNATGDAVDYTYNVLGQLIKAETTSNEWGQSFVFDGFGNLTQQAVTKGSAPSMTLNVNPANNRVTGSGNSYDAAGNLTSTLYGGGMTYDLASRLASVTGMSAIHYAARNERLTVLKSDGTREVHMRGIGGELIGVYRIDWGQNSMYTKPVRLPEYEKVYAAGRLLFEGGKFVATGRLGSVVYKFSQGLAMQNGGFETGVIDPWIPYGGGQATISTVARTGARSLRVTTPIVDRGVYQEVKGLVAGMSYQFQAWVRAESGTNTGALAVCDPAGNGFVWTNVRTITTDWQLLSVWFTATSKGTAWVFLAKWDTTGALLWDDVELVNGATATSGLKMRYYPYGQEVGTATANDVAKFATYTRDAGSGLDYAMNRYYQSWWGRFTSPDPYRASGGPADPGSWNRYSYVQGDPVNYGDPSGLLASPMQWGDWAQFQCFNMAAGLGGFDWAAYVCMGAGGGGGSSYSLGTPGAEPAYSGGRGGVTVKKNGVTFYNVAKKGAKFETVIDSFRTLQERLMEDTDCFGWLTSGTRGALIASSDLFNDLPNYIGVAQRAELNLNNTPGIAAMANVAPGFDIIVNGEGMFFYGGTIPGLPVALSGKSENGRIAILLHELAHISGNLIKDDDADYLTNKTNSATVWSHCQRTITGGN